MSSLACLFLRPPSFAVRFYVSRGGAQTYYQEGDGVISSLVTKREADGDLQIMFAGLTGPPPPPPITLPPPQL